MLDLADRARDGVWVHVPLWVLLGWATGLVASLPVLFWSQTAVFLALTALRLAFERRLAERSVDTWAARLGFSALLLSNALLWGVLGAYALLWPPLEAIRTPLLYVVIGISAAGGMALAIDPVIRFGYPLLAIGPGMVALPFSTEPQGVSLACQALVFALYIVRASRGVAADYWSAVHARVDLLARASELERLGNTDALTQVHSRMFLDRQLGVEWARAQRAARPLSILMIDIDHFKRINDEHGHPFGDFCLQRVARALQVTLQRPADVIARYGGEEFVVLLPEVGSDGAVQVALRLRAAVAAIALDDAGQTVRVTCSIGVHTASPADGDSNVASAMALVDKALYAAKRQGRDRVVTSFDASGGDGSVGFSRPLENGESA